MMGLVKKLVVISIVTVLGMQCLIAYAAEVDLPRAIRLLAADDEKSREEAVAILVTHGHENVALLGEALRNPDALIREGILRVLSVVKEPPLVPDMLKLTADPDTLVRRQLVKTLQTYHDTRCFSTLLTLLQDADPLTREAAAAGLGDLRDAHAIDALLIRLGDADSYVKAQALRALGQIGDVRVFDDVKRLYDTAKEPAVKIAAIAALGDLKDPRAVDILLQAYLAGKRGERDVRYAQALARLGLPAIPSLVQVLLKNPNDTLEISLLLKEFGEPAVDALIKALDSQYAQIRRQCAVGLAWQGNAKAIPVILPLLQDLDARVRSAAAFALGNLKAAGAVHPLLALLADEQDNGVRFQIMLALRSLTGQKFEQDRDAWLKWGNETPR